MKNKAFTLAEVLITLGIIGVVAALTLPAINAKINDRVYEVQRKAAATKLTEAVSMMYSKETLAGVSNIDEFITNLQKELKIAKVCEAGNFDECFPVSVSLPSSLKNLSFHNIFVPPAYALNIAEDDKQNSIDTENVNLWLLYRTRELSLKALRLYDGTSMLIGYNPDCTSPSIHGNAGDDVAGLAVNRQVEESTTILPVSKDLRACVGALIDVNGNKRPNTLGKDIFLYQSSFSNNTGGAGDSDTADEM